MDFIIEVQEKKKKGVVLCSRSPKSEIKQFHVAVVQRLQRNVQKKGDARPK